MDVNIHCTRMYNKWHSELLIKLLQKVSWLFQYLCSLLIDFMDKKYLKLKSVEDQPELPELPDFARVCRVYRVLDAVQWECTLQKEDSINCLTSTWQLALS